MSSTYNVCTKHIKHTHELVELEIAWADEKVKENGTDND